MLYNSYGHAYRLEGKEQYRDILLTGASSLATRYNDVVGCIRSWDHGNWSFPVIIDNMMNLEFLLWAAKVSGDSSYYRIAVRHAQRIISGRITAVITLLILIPLPDRSSENRPSRELQMNPPGPGDRPGDFMDLPYYTVKHTILSTLTRQGK
jgi:hypothetical protein